MLTKAGWHTVGFAEAEMLCGIVYRLRFYKSSGFQYRLPELEDTPK